MLRAVLVSVALWLPGAAHAVVTAEDLAEIRAVINRQIDAFRRDDARGAFELVSPDVQQTFGTAERFLAAVRVSYRPMYRPARVQFMGLIVMGADAVQQVQITDGSGAVWMAYYAMQRQRDGTWRTNGCHLAQPAKTIPT